MLKVYTYNATEAELTEMAELTRREGAKHAKIDAERLTVKVTEVTAYDCDDGKGVYVRPNAADVKLDGRAFSKEKPELKIRWWVIQTMISIRRPVDPSRLTLENTYGTPNDSP